MTVRWDDLMYKEEKTVINHDGDTFYIDLKGKRV